MTELCSIMFFLITVGGLKKWITLWYFRITFIQVFGVLFLYLWTEACAECWLEPTVFEVVSRNGEYLARVIPSEGYLTWRAEVCLNSGGDSGKSLWHREMDGGFPLEAKVSDDGRYVVTMGTHGGDGNGDGEVSLLSSQGAVSKFALEDFAPISFPQSVYGFEGNMAFLFNDRQSRFWRTYNIHFFYSYRGEDLFCLWLDWAEKWICWGCNDGKLRTITDELARALNQEGREGALDNASNQRESAADLNFLSRMGHPDDRPLLLRWLNDTSFFTGLATISTRGLPTNLGLSSSSYKRREAERFLENFYKRSGSSKSNGKALSLKFFGILRGQVHLADFRSQFVGELRIILVPTTFASDHWSEGEPLLVLSNEMNSPSLLASSAGVQRGSRSMAPIGFEIATLTPGNYRIKVFARPPSEPALHGGVGVHGVREWQNVESPLIRILAGRVTEGIHLLCREGGGERIR